MDKDKILEHLERGGYSPALESRESADAWLNAHEDGFGHFIGGKFVRPSSKRYFVTENPATGEELALIAYGGQADVDRAVKAARDAKDDWAGRPGKEREGFIYAIHRSILKNSRLIAVVESLDNGKTIRETRDIDIPLVADHFLYHAGWARHWRKRYPRRVPYGVCGQVIPWNFPLLMLAWKIAPAIATGNTVVLKTAEFTPLSALLFAELLKDEVGLPPGVVNIVNGDGLTGAAIVSHEGVDKVAFTGSTEVGRIIKRAVAGTGKGLSLELGGKNPFIVFADADKDSVIEGNVDAIWFNQGHVCCAGSRDLVEASIEDEHVEALKDRARKLRGATPPHFQLDKTKDIGAINSAKQLKTIQDYCEIGKNEGEMWQPENWDKPNAGCHFPPTVFTGVSPSSIIAQEEIFGPVLVVMPFKTEDEAVRLANNTPFGLAASVWSQDIAKVIDAGTKIKAGTVWLNCTNRFDAAAGFGGVRESGYGREGGPEGILEYTHEVWPEVKPRPSSEYMDLRTLPAYHPAVDITYRFLIGGKIERPDEGKSFRVESVTGELLGVAGDANRKDVRNAVQAARSAVPSWAAKDARLRSKIMYFMAENLAKHKARFVDLLMRETGRNAFSCGREFDAAIDRLAYYAGMADKFPGTMQDVPGKFVVNAIREPIGVLAVRAPDDSPLLGFIGALAPAFSRGNGVVILAGRNPISALEFIQIVQNSDVPAGAINVLSSSDPDALTKYLARHNDVDAIWYYGTREGSKRVDEDSTTNMKRTWTNLGRLVDWEGEQGESEDFLWQSIQIKNMWIPFGV